MLKINYRTLSGGEHSPWLQTSTLDEIVWGGAYELMFASDDGSHGLPFRFTHDEKVTLIVNDNNKGNTHGMHTIVQRLTYVEHATCDLVTYTRTRCCCKGTNAWSEWSVLDGATTSMLQDGSVTAQKLSTDVREKVDNPLRPLFIAAGAEYNDSGADKTKTAPWGETVTHKAGHYYLNGLGDITEEQMMHIYNYKDAIKYLPKREGYRNTLVRTYFTPCEISGQKESQYTHSAFVNNLNLEIVIWTTLDTDINTRSTSYMYNSQGSHFMFSGCKKLKIVYPMNVKSAATMEISNFNGCSSLVEVRLFNLMLNTGFKDSPNISKQSILYIVNNAAPIIAITITLHPNAYARLADDADIVAALEAQPFVSLVSA